MQQGYFSWRASLMTGGTVSIHERLVADGMQKGCITGAVRIMTFEAGLVSRPHAAVGFRQLGWREVVTAKARFPGIKSGLDATEMGIMTDCALTCCGGSMRHTLLPKLVDLMAGKT